MDDGARAPRGTVFTPPAIAKRLLAGLSELVPGSPRYLDPACGNGSLLRAALAAHSGDPDVARHGLYGIDVEPRLVDEARKGIRRATEPLELVELDEHIVCADAIRDAASWPPGCVVLANPPWLSFSGRRAATPRTARQRDRRGWPSLQGEFLECIAQYVGAHGTAARLLLPGSVTELERYGPLRAEVTRWVRLAEAPQELGEDAFPGVIEPAVLVTLIPRGALDRSDSGPWTDPTAQARDLIDAVHGLPRLPSGSFADPGVHTGNCAGELISGTPRPGWARVRQGRDLSAFHLVLGGAWLRTDLEHAPGRRFRIGSIEKYGSFPVLLRQTADRPLAAVQEDPSYFRNSLLACRPVPGLDPHFVAAILNGPVATAWHRSMFRDARQRSFPQVKVAHLATQPFPIAHRDMAPDLHDQLARMSLLAHRTATRTESLLRELRRAALHAFRLPSRVEACVLDLS